MDSASATSINQQAIAKRLGLSQSTVSRALTGDSRISQSTRERVFRAAHTLGYTPNFVARSLVTQSTRNVGVILAETDFHFYALAAIAAQQTLMRHGYSTTLCVTDGRLDREQEYVRFLAERQVDGLIVISASWQPDVGHLRRFRARAPATVVVNRYHADPTLDTILLGDAQGGRLATEYLIGLGHRRIGLIGLERPSPATIRVTQGYRQALRAAGIEDCDEYVVNVPKGVEGGYNAANHLLNRHAKLTAIVAVSDVQAAGALQAITQCGRAVPDDVAVIGYDDTPGAIYTTPPLTSVRMPWEEAGERAAEIVLARLADPSMPPIFENLNCRLAVRRSSGDTRIHDVMTKRPEMNESIHAEQEVLHEGRDTANTLAVGVDGLLNDLFNSVRGGG
jgi:LacI family transcriptional regulator